MKSTMKRKGNESSNEAEKAEAPAPKKGRGRRGKPKLSKVEYKKKVNDSLMMETLENNALMQNVFQKQGEFRRDLNNKLTATPPSVSQAIQSTSRPNK